MIGIVVVSHSPALAKAAVDLALQMVGSSPPPIALAAGAGDDVIGTDATRVASAIDEVASDDGVLVFMDLGSAVMSAEMGLEFRSSDCEVRLSDGPFVEGLVAAVVLAAAGSSLDDVAREASRAMEPKQGAVGPAPAAQPSAAQPPTEPDAVTAEVTLVNPAGLHARPVSMLVKTVSEFDAAVKLEDLTSGKGPVSAASLIAVLTLGSAQGNVIRISATGPQAADAVEAVRAMAADGFGEE
ncbi:HPr family phosphocarrier protein [Glaciihabitans arcticus]|uniref:phosphoenolpyruvate--glycerone phosphotransferase n=1 Tax=Glaciihabitans arcticus TaxID=2668039 RepID=A0A4Q9GXT5_9MICO|nr:dihydroxyacetone kinase phosphoryl donor subunit DhaM [Glaciihabitans arcticus]TBN57573.1 HPr family phosphocarrier protein [Glaciihabitans arcticus]